MASVISAGTTASTAIAIAGDTSGVLELQSNGTTTALTINTGQGVKVKNTIGVGDATPSTSGAGITFPATQSASSDANTLDDYEEGNWTPVAIGSTTAGTGTYGLQTGRYTKIGRVCFFQMTLGWSAHTGTGSLQINGLPFTSLGSTQGQSVASLGYNNGMAYSASNIVCLYIGSNDTKIYFTQSNTSGGISNISLDTVVDELIINGHYIVA